MSERQGQRAAATMLEAELVERVLAPYKPNCRYVREAWVRESADPTRLVEIEAKLAIPESCYIDDTGHFNSVEFNLCYNQLVYLLMAQCVVGDLLAPFARMDLAEYLRRQLPDVLIHDFQSKFKKPIHMRDFLGRVWITNFSERRRFLLLHTGVEYEDSSGGASSGSVSLAIVSRGEGPATAAAGS